MPLINIASSEFANPFGSELGDEKYTTYASSEIVETSVHATLQQERSESVEITIPHGLQESPKLHDLLNSVTAECEAAGTSVDRHNIGVTELSHESLESQTRGPLLSDFERGPTVSFGSLESRSLSSVPVSDSSEDEKELTPKQAANKATQKIYQRMLKEVANSNRSKGKKFSGTRAKLSLHAHARSFSKSGVVNRLLTQGLEARVGPTPVEQIKKTHVEKMVEKRKANARKKDPDDQI